MIKCILACLLCQEAVVCASMMERVKRFLTPTTYPVPTTFLVPTTIDKISGQSLSSLLANSRPVNCPVKRDTRARRINLDSNMMREIYLQQVGPWDSHFVAESQQEAEENFIDMLAIRNNQTEIPRRRKQDVLQQLKRIPKERTDIDNTSTIKGVEESDSQSLSDNNSSQGGLNVNKVNSSLKLLLSLKKESRKRRRSSDGTVTTIDYCNPRGTQTSDGFIHMCATCALTTTLPNDRFPRYINEGGCDNSDCNCFTIKNTVHGQCQPRRFYVKILRKVVNGCRLLIHNGQHLIIDNWEVYDQPIQVGCECVLDKRSPFASYIVGK